MTPVAAIPVGARPAVPSFSAIAQHRGHGESHAESRVAGSASVELQRVKGRTAVLRARSCSPLKLLLPHQRSGAAWICTSTFGGGLVAGDSISLELHAGPGTKCLLSTQSATKVYRAQGGQGCRQSLHVMAGEDAVVVSLPDPVICFGSAVYEQRQTFLLHESASLVALDWLSSGRLARGERWAFDRYRSRTEIRSNGVPVFIDALLLDSTVADLTAPHRLGKFDCLAVAAIVGPRFRDAAQRLLAEVAAEPLQRSPRLLCAASPLPAGAVLRVIGPGAQEVGQRLRHLLGFVASVLGEDPWARKW